MRIKVFLSILIMLNCKAGVYVIGSLTHEFQVSGGDMFSDGIDLENRTPYPVSVHVYQADYLFHHDGRTQYETPSGAFERSNALWLTPADSHLVLPPESGARLSIAIAIPDTGAFAGTYWSLIMIEPERQTEPLDTAPQFTRVFRYAVQYITHFSGGAKAIRILGTQLKKPESIFQLQVNMENTGTMLVRPEMSLQLFDAAGKKIAKFRGTAPRLFPGTSIRFVFDLVDVPAGEYPSLLLIDCGVEALFGAKYTLNILK